MTVEKKTKYGQIEIDQSVIAGVAGDAALSCYGVMGLVEKGSLRNSIQKGINELFLKRTDFVKGVYCHKSKNAYEVDVYIVVAYGVKLTEVITEVQKKVSYDLKKTFPVEIGKVNVFIENVQEIE